MQIKQNISYYFQFQGTKIPTVSNSHKGQQVTNKDSLY